MDGSLKRPTHRFYTPLHTAPCPTCSQQPSTQNNKPTQIRYWLTSDVARQERYVARQTRGSTLRKFTEVRPNFVLFWDTICIGTTMP